MPITPCRIVSLFLFRLHINRGAWRGILQNVKMGAGKIGNPRREHVRKYETKREERKTDERHLELRR